MNTESINYWEECQPHLVEGGREMIESLSQEDALGLIQEMYPDQTDSAVQVLERDSWLPARGVVSYLLDKWPNLKPIIASWWSEIEGRASAKWEKETGQGF